MKINKTPLDEFGSLKMREKDLRVTVDKREGKDMIDSNLKHPFNRTKTSCEIESKIFLI